MGISKYEAYFHDGSLYNIEHKKNQIILSMSSAEMDTTDMKDDIPFSSDDTLKGRLHIEGIKSITIDDKPLFDILKMHYEKAGIFNLEIKKHSVELQLIWKTYTPKPKEMDFSTIKIEATTIYWEPVPDLVDPLW
jgi:hypothetical protein